ncbi:carboxylesterase family protein [Nonomuraea sp. NPDC004297]
MRPRQGRGPDVLRDPLRRAPVGRLRWAPTVAARPRGGVADATKPGPACPQAALPGVPPTGEDCLFLNATMPRDASGTRLPVMVWLHGGGFTTGTGSQYDAPAPRHSEQRDGRDGELPARGVGA